VVAFFFRLTAKQNKNTENEELWKTRSVAVTAHQITDALSHRALSSVAICRENCRAHVIGKGYTVYLRVRSRYTSRLGMLHDEAHSDLY